MASSAVIQEISYDGIAAHLLIQRHPGDVVVLKLTGCDTGEFRQAPMRKLDETVSPDRPMDLFIDARDAYGASIEVSGDWAAWLASNRAALRSVTMLTGSRFIQVTAEFVRRFASLEGLMRICTEPTVFDAALAEKLAHVEQQ